MLGACGVSGGWGVGYGENVRGGEMGGLRWHPKPHVAAAVAVDDDAAAADDDEMCV